MDVHATGGDVAEPPADLGTDQSDADPDSEKPEDEADVRHEERQPAVVDDRFLEPMAHPLRLVADVVAQEVCDQRRRPHRCGRLTHDFAEPFPARARGSELHCCQRSRSCELCPVLG